LNLFFAGVCWVVAFAMLLTALIGWKFPLYAENINKRKMNKRDFTYLIINSIVLTLYGIVVYLNLIQGLLQGYILIGIVLVIITCFNITKNRENNNEMNDL